MKAVPPHRPIRVLEKRASEAYKANLKFDREKRGTRNLSVNDSLGKERGKREQVQDVQGGDSQQVERVMYVRW